MQRLWVALGALAGLTAVAMAALATHGLQELDPSRLAILHGAIEMQAWHALALLATGLWVPRGGKLAACAGAAFASGMLLFCGALYSLALAGRGLGIVAPVGGALLMFGWVMLGVSATATRRLS
jgi:uncharacterized membrane protein YgdD (TMEM256/DUF423 family)